MNRIIKALDLRSERKTMIDKAFSEVNKELIENIGNTFGMSYLEGNIGMKFRVNKEYYGITFNNVIYRAKSNDVESYKSAIYEEFESIILATY